MSIFRKSSTVRPIILVGSGSHAKVVLEALGANDPEIVGFTDEQPNEALVDAGIKYLGSDKVISNYRTTAIYLINGVGSSPGCHRRYAISKKMRDDGYEFANVRHPSVVGSTSTIIGNGSQLMAGVVLQTNVSIGKDVVVNTSASVDHDCIIGDYSWISPGVTLCGLVTVGTRAYIGAGSTIIQQIDIGSDVVIGAGSTVVKDVEPGGRVIQRR